MLARAPPRPLNVQRLRSELPPVSSSDTALVASVQLASLQNGHIIVPNATRYALIEIGTSDRDTYDDGRLPSEPHAFLLAFEPLMDKYAVLLARGTTRQWKKVRDRTVPLGHHHARGIIIPLAVSPNGGPVDFNVQRVAGCSSLARLNRHAWWAPWCHRELEKRVVPSITLETAIGLIPPHLPIHTLKIDAQGVDFRLLRSAPPALLRLVQAPLWVATPPAPPMGRFYPTKALECALPYCTHVQLSLIAIAIAQQ